MESKEQMNEMLQQEPTPAEKDRKRMDGLLSPSKENQTKDTALIIEDPELLKKGYQFKTRKK